MPAPARQVLEVENHGDMTVVKFVDSMIMDEPIIKAIGDQLFSLVDDQGRRNVTLNFDKVQYLGSFALGKLTTLHKKLKAAGGKLVLCNLDPDIYEIFQVSHLDRFFDIQKNAGDDSGTIDEPGA